VSTVGNLRTMALITGSRALSERNDGFDSTLPSIWKPKHNQFEPKYC